MSCKTPVVFIIFRRPDLTVQVFEAIRQARPEKLLKRSGRLVRKSCLSLLTARATRTRL